MEIAQGWCRLHKMELSPTKSVMMLLKGGLDTGRPPTIRISDRNMKMVTEFCYLGIDLQSGIMGPKIGLHMKKISLKCKNIFGSLRRVAKRDWGLGYKALSTIYKGVFTPIATYAAAAWYDMANAKDLRTLKLAQRFALISTTRAYRSTSAEAIQVAAGAIPVNLLAEQRMLSFKIRKGKPVVIEGDTYRPSEEGEYSRTEAHIAKKAIRTYIVHKWQEEWDERFSDHITYRFFPNVEERLKMRRITINHYIIQFLVGHGNFKAKLKELGLLENERCSCGENDTHAHVLFA